jgi:glutamyl-tRNA reductase
MYRIISFNYKNSDVETRGKLSVLVNHYDEFKKYGEVIIVATCNRIELATFSSVKNPFLVKIEQLTGVDPRKAFIYEGIDAIIHIFKVLSSIDSMVVGETQITGQYKEAFMSAYEEGAVKKNLSRVMHHGFKCAKRVRNETNLSSNPVSVASIAVKKAKEVLGDLGGYSAVVVGAGDTSRIICKHLEKAGVNIILVNRTYENAAELKEEIEHVNVDIHSIDKLPKFINNYRLLFTATSSKEPIIKNDMIEDKEFQRYWFDLAIPQDICNIQNENINVFRVDDLKDISDENIKQREQELQKANKIIEEEIQNYLKFIKESEITPTIKMLRKKAEIICKDVIQNAIKKHFIKKEDEKEVEKIVYTAFKRFLHNPTLTLKENANEPQIDVLLSSIKKLFKVDDNLVDMNKCEYNSPIKNDKG